MMNNYLFETCRGEFNWNKLMSKSVHLVGNSHIYIYIYIYITMHGLESVKFHLMFIGPCIMLIVE